MSIEANIARVRQAMDQACLRAGRDPAGVRLIAVSKGHPPQAVEEAFRAGISLFGENKVQEGRAKIPLCSSRITWHMIGHLQTNKVRDALGFFSVIQSVDSLRLAEEIHRLAERQAKTAKILLEVNVAGEGSKFGYRPAQLVEEIRGVSALKRLEIHGLMTIAPWSTDSERVRPFFRSLRELRSRCEDLLGYPIPELSMGMSGDFGVAIEEGATMVRIGTAIFGARPRRLDREEQA
ncbi:MAG: YggS family pyridoxal phosphate-dependent enzyme [Verrucomicrobia bacterium]|nr:YggS family pyridoxal phosphate-dependent enzyme [Verrucomicrobiota bacterium]